MSQPSCSSAAPPRARKALQADGLGSQDAAGMGQMEKNPQAPRDWHGWDPTAHVLRPPRPHAGERPLPFRWHPRWRDQGCQLLPRAIQASDGWLGRMDQAASLSATDVVGRSSSFFQEVACRKTSGHLEALRAGCLPSSCGGRGYRRTRTRRTRGRWRARPSAGWGTGPCRSPGLPPPAAPAWRSPGGPYSFEPGEKVTG